MYVATTEAMLKYSLYRRCCRIRSLCASTTFGCSNVSLIGRFEPYRLSEVDEFLDSNEAKYETRLS